MVEELQKKFHKELDNFKKIEKETHKHISQRKLLDSQLNENKAVATELELQKPDADVYKLIGPVLVKQSLDEARQNVAKRMEYISKELARIDGHIAALQQKKDSSSAALGKLEKDFMKAEVKTNLKR